MKWMYRISIKMKLLIALMPPLLALCWFAGSEAITRIQVEQQMNNIGRLATLIHNAGNLVHELQKERGLSSGYLNSSGNLFGNELAAQRKQTDQVAETFNRVLAQTDRTLLQDDLIAVVKGFTENIKRLDTIRQSVDQHDPTATKVLDFYGDITTGILNFVGGVGHLTDSGKMVNEFAAYYSLLNMKEQASTVRALLSGVFSADRFNSIQFRIFSDAIGKQEAWLAAAYRFSTPTEMAVLSKMLHSRQATDALAMREIAFNKATEGGFGIQPADWFSLQTQRIEIMHKAESTIAHVLQEHATTLSTKARADWQQYLAISFFAVLVSVVFAIAIMRSLHQHLISTLRTIKEMEGNLTRRLVVPGNDELSALNIAYNNAIENIQHIIQEIKSGSAILSNASSDIAAGNQDLAQRTEQQASSIVETAASMEQISTAIIQTADNAREADSLVQLMERNVLEANHVVKEANVCMNEIHTSSEKITHIVKSIDDVSFQTNLLALNAAVEAARAGEAGKGFAVVASEVRNLSQRCAAEADQIRQLVKQNMSKIGEGVERVTASATALQVAAENTSKIKHYVGVIAMAASEQSQGVALVHQALNQLEQVTQQNATLVSQAADASHMLDKQSQDTMTLVNRFIV